MTDTSFFHRTQSLSAQQVADLCQGTLNTPQFSDRLIEGLSSLAHATETSLCFADGMGREAAVAALRGGTLICSEQQSGHAASNVAVIVVLKPQQAFAKIGRILFPEAVQPTAFASTPPRSPSGWISPSALIEQDVTIEAGAVVGANAQIGSGTLIGAGAIIGDNVKIGRNCIVGPTASILYALVGNNVIVHAGARIGQDGFGFVAGAGGLEKMPQLGRVIIQDKVEIGANTTVDRGAIDDTIIGEGTKIDNLVQIAHNCRIGRSCVITAHCGLSGSVTLGDGVMLGGRVGIADHVTVGAGAQVAATSGVMNDIGPGERWAGTPAQPIKEFFREVAVIRSMVRDKKGKTK